MTIKAAIRERLVADPTFVAAVAETRLFTAGAIQTAPDLNLGKFGVLRYDSARPRIANVTTTPFYLYVYDRLGGPYKNIDAALERARVVLEGIGQLHHSDGWIISVKWLGKSGELVDDAWRASVEFATFEVTASGT